MDGCPVIDGNAYVSALKIYFQWVLTGLDIEECMQNNLMVEIWDKSDISACQTIYLSLIHSMFHKIEYYMLCELLLSGGCMGGERYEGVYGVA